MKYAYRAINHSGHIIKGICIASNASDLEKRLDRQGLTLIAAKTKFHMQFLNRRICRRDLATYAFHIEQLLRAGVPILEALVDVRDSTESNLFQSIIMEQIEALESGSAYSEALAADPAIFDTVFVNLVRIGEETGTLSEVLKDIAAALKWQEELATQIQKSLFYPAMASIFVFGAVFFVLIYLVPQLVSFIRDMKLPLSLGLQVIVNISDSLNQYGVVLLVSFAGVALTGWWRFRTDPSFRMRLAHWKLKAPFFGNLLHKAIVARFAHHFALMYRAGIPLLDCIKLSQGIVGNQAIAAALANISNDIRQGEPLSISFEASMLFPPLVLRMLRVGENTGSLDISLMNVADFYQHDVKDAVERAQSLIEPLLTTILGLLLASILFSVLGPIFDLLGKLE